MPADDRDHEPRGLAAFTTYADGTPRAPGAPSDPAPRWDEPIIWDPDGTSAPKPPPRRAYAWPKVAAGLAILTAFGAGLLVARTGDPASVDSRPAAVTEARPPASQPLNVEVAAAAPAPSPPPPTSYGAKLEVLAADMPAPKATAPLARPAPPLLAIGPRPTPEVQAPPPREVARAPLASDATATAPASFDCADAPTLARQMVCMDSGLAALDRRMKQAFAQAVAAGVPEQYLGEDQQDWLDVREEAARISRRSVVNIYRQRIDELHTLADRDWD